MKSQARPATSGGAIGRSGGKGPNQFDPVYEKFVFGGTGCPAYDMRTSYGDMADDGDSSRPGPRSVITALSILSVISVGPLSAHGCARTAVRRPGMPVTQESAGPLLEPAHLG